jgi:hypothetical protein
MGKQYTATEMAKELGIEPKKLRALLRDSTEFTAPGSGASWAFTDGDKPRLRRIVKDWQGRPKGSKTQRTTSIRDDAGLPMSVAMRDRRAVRLLSEARVDRLEEALLAAGLHISQINERNGWIPQQELVAV